MSIRNKLVTAATTLAVMAGVGAAGTLTANAATPKCGAACADFYSGASGTSFVLDTANTAGQAGQALTLAKASGASKGEDFTVDALGTVHDFYQAGLLSGGLNKLYSGLFVYEIEYTPRATPSNLCQGTAGTPGAGTPVTLESCGMKAKTVWIFAQQKTNTGTFYALISAATSNGFQHPYVLTTLKPGAPLVTAQLVASTATGYTHQLWSAVAGVLPSSSTH